MTLRISPSQLRGFDRCERSWWLTSVASVTEDAGAGGQYLAAGDLFDEACQLHQARMDLSVDALVQTCRRRRGDSGLEDAKWRELAERAVLQLRAAERFLPAPKTATIQHWYCVPYGVGVHIVGKADFRRPGRVWDTKTTSDRGPGRGRDGDTPPRALNVDTLAGDVQARVYAWCEFQLNPDLHWCEVSWVYVSKPSGRGAPEAWVVSVTFSRSDTLDWFDAYAPPRLARMAELHAAVSHEALVDIRLDQRAARANHDGCTRCFRRNSCWPFEGAQAHEGGNMVDVKKLRAEQAARAARGEKPGPLVAAMETELETALRASLVAEATAAASAPGDRRADIVPINRPDAPANPAAAPAIIDTTGHEVPKEPSTEVAGPTVKRGRGRPRKGAGGAGVMAAPEDALAEVLPAINRLERIATALQAVADAADAAVATVNAELRALGVKL